MEAIELVNYIDCPEEKIFEALTTSKGLAATWTQVCKVENKVGGLAEFGFGDEPLTRFTITELEPHKKISWHCFESDPEWKGTTVTFEIYKQGSETAVKLIHSGWSAVTEYFRWCNYNWAFFLYSLKQYLEEGKGIPFQERKF